MSGQKNNFISSVKENSLRLSHEFLKNDSLTFAESTADELKFNEYMSIIRLNGAHIRVEFRVYYDLDRAAALVAPLYDSPHLTPLQIIDSMREYCNQAGGLIKRILTHNNIETGHSIPFSIRAYHDIFLNTNSQTTRQSCWRIQDPKDHSIDCFVNFYSKNKDTLKILEDLNLDTNIDDSKPIEMF